MENPLKSFGLSPTTLNAANPTLRCCNCEDRFKQEPDSGSHDHLSTAGIQPKILDLSRAVSQLVDEMERVAYTPKEFAALFGKSQTWGYRQIYSGAVASTTEHGRTLIPAREVEKILSTAQAKGKKPQAAVPPVSPSAAKEQDNSLRSVLIRGSKSRSKGARSPKISGSQPPPKP